ncbi:transporter substrate-binding domain-containing protein [uncultured Helicobacter sp.]|uniref:substrate-binding periplasmic protein n=1 Tax=uncultured Helicobacter sp. TaxID=175537 RepID=UPI00258B8878|nr:transporter substrate-binding domain-containing protein [uncultured Helicobacter sp.]
MQKNQIVKILLLVLVCGFGACKDSASSTKTFSIACSDDDKPLSYQENGELKGFGIELAKLLNDTNNNLQTVINTINTHQESLLQGLESKKFDVIITQIPPTKQLQDQFIISAHPYLFLTLQILVPESSPIHTLQDLNQKSIATLIATPQSKALQEWNAKEGNIIDIHYYRDNATLFEALQNGAIDDVVGDAAMISDYIQNLALRSVGESIAKEPLYLIYKDKDVALVVDKALEEIIDSGALRDLSLRVFGVDKTQ